MENISDVLADLELAIESFLYKSINNVIVVKDKLKALGYASIDSKHAYVAKAFSFVSCSTGKMSKS